MQAEPNSLHSEIMRKEALRLPRLPIKRRTGEGGGGGGGGGGWYFPFGHFTFSLP